jgi:CRP-like cAMP-binding protein
LRVIDQCLIRDRVQTLVELDEETLDELTQGLEIQSYVPGQVIIRQGTLGETFYLIIEGEVEAIAELPDGTERVINRLKRGQYFGEIALLGSGRRTVTVRAGGAAPVKIVEMDRPALDVMYQSEQLKDEIDRLATERLADSNRAKAS